MLCISQEPIYSENDDGQREEEERRTSGGKLIVRKREYPISDSDRTEGDEETGTENIIQRNARRHPLGRFAVTGYTIHTLRQMQFR